MSKTAFEICNGEAASKLLFLCDHASSEIPAELGTLGLGPEMLTSHIAYDIGAGAVTRALAERFRAPAVLGRWSRLVVDLNRGADDPTVVMRISDGQIVPGNRDLGAADIAQRIARYHAPYHLAIETRIGEALARGVPPTLFSIHSFTPVWRGVARPWHFGVLWDRDGRLAQPLLAQLRRESDMVIGDNEPYSGDLENDCLYRHGTMTGLPHALIEIRQDMIATEAGVERIATQLHTVLRAALDAMGSPGGDLGAN